MTRTPAKKPAQPTPHTADAPFADATIATGAVSTPHDVNAPSERKSRGNASQSTPRTTDTLSGAKATPAGNNAALAPPHMDPSHIAPSHDGVLQLMRQKNCTYKEALTLMLRQGHWPQRFARNATAFTAAQMCRLLDSRVLIAGCGGLGGHVAASLARLGVGEFVLYDDAIFDESNVNRQYFCTQATLGQPKALVCGDGIRAIAPYATVDAHVCALRPSNALSAVRGVNAVLDCLDNIPHKKMLEQTACAAGCIYIHGAVSAQEGFAYADNPAQHRLDALYPRIAAASDTAALPCAEDTAHYAAPVFTVSGVAALMVSLAAQSLTTPAPLHSPLLHMDYAVPALEGFDV